MNLSIIAAMARNRVIGAGSKLPWHLSEDLKRFKKLTMGHPVVMGRKTFESIGKPLSGRDNLVLTRQRAFHPNGVTVAHSFEEILSICGRSSEAFVIGGAEIFRMALPYANRLYLTQIDQDFKGDAYFPEFDLKKDFDVVEDTPMQAESGIPFRFVTAVRREMKTNG